MQNFIIYIVIWNLVPSAIRGSLPPTPRLYCDICEIFDAHETEDCPKQSSDAQPAAPKTKSKPQPRSYCETCEGEFFFFKGYFFLRWIFFFKGEFFFKDFF